jgi:hypothetical protein
LISDDVVCQVTDLVWRFFMWMVLAIVDVCRPYKASIDWVLVLSMDFIHRWCISPISGFTRLWSRFHDGLYRSLVYFAPLVTEWNRSTGLVWLGSAFYDGLCPSLIYIALLVTEWNRSTGLS